MSLDFIGDYIFVNLEYLTKSSTGLILVKNIIDFFKSSISCKIIQNKIIFNFYDLIQDSIGNNVIQEVLKININNIDMA